jgi:hypothetical protein
MVELIKYAADLFSMCTLFLFIVLWAKSVFIAYKEKLGLNALLMLFLVFSSLKLMDKVNNIHDKKTLKTLHLLFVSFFLISLFLAILSNFI